MSLAQRRHCWQGVKNISHGPQPDHQQTILGLRVQALIFAQTRGQPEFEQLWVCVGHSVLPRPIQRFAGLVFDLGRVGSNLVGSF
jgi:hypothetical protein